MKNTRDSTLVTFVREGENMVARVRHNTAMRRALGVGFLRPGVAPLHPPWFLIPGLMFAGLWLLGFNPFWFGSCGSKKAGGEGGLEQSQRAALSESPASVGPFAALPVIPGVAAARAAERKKP